MATPGNGAKPESADDGSKLGVGAGLGLPLPPPRRGRVYKLPPPKVSFEGVAPLSAPSEVEEPVTAAVVAVRSGRIRLTTMLGLGLRWPDSVRLVVKPAALRGKAGERPVLVVAPTSSKRDEASELSAEGRLSLSRKDRRFLGIEASDCQVLVAFRHREPDALLIAGPAALSSLLSEAWPHEV